MSTHSDHDKYKAKIKKLLALSLSDNEHEAQNARRQAMLLMRKHNLTEDEVKGQQTITHDIITDYYRIPCWCSDLFTLMSQLSGCFLVYQNGSSQLKKKARFTIIGKERDVENAVYLITFLTRATESATLSYQSNLTLKNNSQKAHYVRSYKAAFIRKVYERLNESQQQFFSQTHHQNLVCVDNASRFQAAKEHYTKTLGHKVSSRRSSSTYIANALNQGFSDAERLQINNAMAKQSSIKRIG